jgi:tetratricopeptide (TPR) repeat protein
MIHSTLRIMKEAEGSTPEDVLRRLAVCRGGFTLDAAQAICADYLDRLDDALWTLQTWQFVGFDQAAQRYRLDPLAEAILTPDESSYHPHYTFYKALAWKHDSKEDYFGLDVESDNLTAAFEWAIKGDGEDALWLANAVSNYLYNRGRFGQSLNWTERAATVLAHHQDKMLWANAQNSLGTDYINQPLGMQLEYLRKAIAAYEAALEYYTPQVAPLDYAATQNNLGNAYSELSGIEDQANNLRRAIAAYEAALEFCTPQVAPLDYAQTQNNLGNAYIYVSKIEDPLGNLRKAIAAYEAALAYRTPQAVPLGYATTQNNLGIAYRDLSETEDRLGNLRKAITAYEAALEYRTPQAAPVDYAQTQLNLALTYKKLGDLPSAIACGNEAERYYRQMDMLAEADLMLEWIEATAGKG